MDGGPSGQRLRGKKHLALGRPTFAAERCTAYYPLNTTATGHRQGSGEEPPDCPPPTPGEPEAPHLVELALLLLQRAHELPLLLQVHDGIVQLLPQLPAAPLQPLHRLCLLCQAQGQGLDLAGCPAPGLLPCFQRPRLLLLAPPPL